jgi:hypothetical protein
VFDSLLGPHLPLASVWEAHSSDARQSGTATIREKSGRSLQLAYSLERLTPDLHVIAFVHALV